MSKRSRPARLRLPDELDGAFTGLIIGTFGASLDFAEAQLFRQLSKSTVNRVVLADGRQLNAFLAGDPPIRRLNRAYVAAPVSSPHAHHPKYVLLVGPDAGRLFVGSGNLSISGYAGAGECFTAHEWNKGDDATTAAAFAAVKSLINGTVGNGWVDHVTRDRIRDVFGAAPWIPDETGADSPVVHNLERPLLDQLVERVAGATVREVVAAAPFHDKNAHAVRQILSVLKPSRFRLLVQEGLTRLDTKALGKVLAKHGDVEVMDAAPPSPYPNALLHAKFILVRTEAFDFLLQGSANLSRVALCEHGADGNVEIANLLSGGPGEFDHLLEGLDLSIREDGIQSFTPDDDWGNDDEDDLDQPTAGPQNVCWTPPTLTGHLPVGAGSSLQVLAAGTQAAPTDESWDATGDGIDFSLEFDESTVARIDRARFIELVDESGETWVVYPYHLHSLIRLSASGNRADLLQEVGDLDLRDKELEELVAELDRVLIIDGRSLWRLAHPEARTTKLDNDSESPHVKYEELDWTRIGELPQLKQYGTAAHRALLAPTELGIVLQALTRRFRAEVQRAGGGLGGEDADGDDDLGLEPESEDADEADDAADPEEEESRRIAPRQRVRRLWRHFVRRFVKGLSDEEFVRSVGSAVIVPSYVVFNHLCRRLRVVDLVDADFLTEAQIGLWSFMWGGDGRTGYLSMLPPEERAVAMKILADHEDLSVTLAAFDDAWWHVWEDSLDPIPLRSAWRHFLEADGWAPEPGALKQAAAVASRCGGDQDKLFDDLYELAAHFEEQERDREIAKCLGVTVSQLRIRHDSVVRNGSTEDCEYFDVGLARLTAGAAAAAFATWKAFEPDRRYFRVTSHQGVAVIDLDHHDGFYYDKEHQVERPLLLGDRQVPAWEAQLLRLLDAA